MPHSFSTTEGDGDGADTDEGGDGAKTEGGGGGGTEGGGDVSAVTFVRCVFVFVWRRMFWRAILELQATQCNSSARKFGKSTWAKMF